MENVIIVSPPLPTIHTQSRNSPSLTDPLA